MVKTFFKKYKLILTNIVVWVSIILSPIFIFQMPGDDYYIHVYRSMFNIVMLIPFYYLNTSVFIPKFLTKQKFKSFALSSLFIIVSIVTISSLLRPDFKDLERRDKENHAPKEMAHFDEKPPPNNHFIDFGSIFIAVIVIAVSTSIKITKEWYNNEKQKNEIERQKLTSDLSLLKSQVNPHFLFNTLNSIYSLANKKSDNTKEAILKLAELMRYMLYDSESEFVDLEKEVDYLSNFIKLQELRTFDNVNIIFDIKGDINKRIIEPKLLIPFVENAFKHGDLTTENPEIYIILETNDNELKFKVINPVDITDIANNESPNSTGLKNVRRRLDLLYPNNHNLKTAIVGDKYVAELIIKLKQNELYNS